MKIQLDTTNKTIKVEESVSLKELTEALEKLLPNDEWKGFKLETNTTIHNWAAPIIIRERRWPLWDSPWYTTSNPRLYNSSTSELQYQQNYSSSNVQKPILNEGVFNIEA